VRVDADGQQIELIEQGGIGDGQVVSDAACMTGPEDGAVPPFAGIIANPPPEVFRVNQFKGLIHRGPGDLAAINSVGASSENRRPLVHICFKKLRVARLVEAAKQAPVLARHIRIFGMAVGAAFFVELGLKHIQYRDLFSVRIACFVSGETAGNLPADQADPPFRYQADSSNTAMVMLVGVCKADDPVGPRGVMVNFGF